MRYILDEDFKSFDEYKDENGNNFTKYPIPTLKNGVPDWREIFSTAHPIDPSFDHEFNDTDASGKDISYYEAMTLEDLWNEFYSDKEFGRATGITEPGAGEKLKTNMPPIFREELLKVSFSKTVNPFLVFLEKTYIADQSKYAKLPEMYNAIHNAYVQNVISKQDLSNTTVMNKVLVNPSLYTKFSIDKILNLLQRLNRARKEYPGNAAEFSALTTDSNNPENLFIALLCEGLDWDGKSAVALESAEFLSYSEIDNNLKQIGAGSKQKVLDSSESKKAIEAHFKRLLDAAANNDAKKVLSNKILTYLAMKAGFKNEAELGIWMPRIETLKDFTEIAELADSFSLKLSCTKLNELYDKLP